MTHSLDSRKLSIFISHPSDRLTNCKPDGDGLVAFGFIEHLAKRGHTLHVVVNSAEIEGDLPDNIKLYPTQLETVPAPLQRIAYAHQCRQIFNHINRQSLIDVIHQLNPVVTGLSLSLVGTRIPVVLGPIVASWPHNTKLTLSQKISVAAKELIRNGLFYLQQQQADALLIATPVAANRLYHPDTIAHKVFDLRHGIDANQFRPLDDQRDNAHPRILFLGQISYHKGVLTLLDAFEQIAQQLPTCELYLAGPWGSVIDQVKERISNMACHSRIMLPGSIPRSEIPQLMNCCTVYCMPSYGEAFGMGALEAMACGKPIVGTDAGGLKYLIPDEGGRKVSPGDANALADALLEILSSPELQIQMGQHNRAVVEQVYRWEKVAQRLEEVYYKQLNTES